MKSSLFALVFCTLISLAGPAVSPAPGQIDPNNPARLTPDEILRRKVEGLARSGHQGEAIDLLEKRRGEGEFPDELLRRLVRLYRETAQWSRIETLLLELHPDESGLDFTQLRQLARARFQLGRTDEAFSTLDRALALDPHDASRISLVSNLLAQWGNFDRAVAVLLQGRRDMEEPLEFAQTLSRHYQRMGRPGDAVREACRVVVASPLNLAIMRGPVVQMAMDNPGKLSDMLAAAREVQEKWPGVPQLSVLVAEIAIVGGDDDLAWEQLRPLLDRPALAQGMLRIAIAGLADSRLPGTDPEISLRRLRMSVRITRALMGNEVLPRSLEPRAHDTLVRSLLGMLDNSEFLKLDDEDRASWLNEGRLAVLEMNRRFPGNALSGAAALRLAEVYSGTEGNVDKAIELFSSIASNPSSSLPNIATARLGLARSYVADGDTTRARTEFLSIAANTDDPSSQGRAQYHLGLLDFMGGELEMASTRFRAVAQRAPRADYTNDALDMAILLADEEMQDEPDTEGLKDYGRMLYHRATHQRDSMVVNLEDIAERDAGPVRERARLDLARFRAARGETAEALSWLDRLVAETPGSRAVPEALDLRAEILLDEGRTQLATETWERILLEHEDYVFIDQVRDHLATLRNPDGPDPAGREVP